MFVSVPRDAGNIEVIDASDPAGIRLAIRADAHSDHMQWFHFRITGVRGTPLRIQIENAGRCSYPKAWHGYQAVASSDRQRWLRVQTSYRDGVLHIEHTPGHDAIWFAYFAPYPMVRHHDRNAAWASLPGVQLQRLGATLDGEDLDLLKIGDEHPDRPVVWITARQHPGETMAAWFVEGMLDRLLDPADGLARALRQRATWFVVPNMNPDGSRRGHLRTNAAGTNLNRAWHAPTVEASPEVLLVRDRMDATGVDLSLDIHGDEELPYNFVSGAEGVPGWDARRAALQARFIQRWIAINPDFQAEHGYPVDAPGQANLSMCTNQVAERYGAVAMTIEQPFKDTDNAPCPETGWSPARAVRLGASVLGAVAEILGDLR